jgi:hypothetical protein
MGVAEDVWSKALRRIRRRNKMKNSYICSEYKITVYLVLVEVK